MESLLLSERLSADDVGDNDDVGDDDADDGPETQTDAGEVMSGVEGCFPVTSGVDGVFAITSGDFGVFAMTSGEDGLVIMSGTGVWDDGIPNS